jgi:tetratricopeptide (TPR) repeat protein
MTDARFFREAGAVAVLCAVALTAGNALSARLRPVLVTGGGLNRAQQEQLEKNASVSLFGQFRSSMADFLWLKADRYLHKGVDLRAKTETEHATARAQNVKTTEAEQEDHRSHGDETTVVPAKEFDWRGRLGDLERAVQPFQAMGDHHHEDPKETLPLFRLMTRTNPNFVPGYVVGAAMMARDRTKIREGLAFLQEGERNNPDSIEIQEGLAYFHAALLKELPLAIQHATRGLALATGRDRTTFTDEEKEAHQALFRWAVLAYRDSGKVEEAKAYARAGLALYPEDVVCRRMLGLIK